MQQYVVHRICMHGSPFYLFFTTTTTRRAHDVVGIITRKDLLPESIDAQFFRRGQYTPDGTLDTEAGSMLMNARSTAFTTPSSPGMRPGERGCGSVGGQAGAQAASSENEVALTVEGVTKKERRTQRQL